MKATVFEIENAFLHQKLDEAIYMYVPPGLEVNESQKLFLLKAIYALVEIAREFTRRYLRF
jgi:hypothetical protein